MRKEELKDRPVISIAEGTKLGSVHELLVDGTFLQIAALVIGGGGVLGGHKEAVGYDAVRGIGPDAVMVSGRDAVQEIKDGTPFAGAHGLGAMHQEVMTESGVHLGRVDDVEFDPQTGALTGLWFKTNGETAAHRDDMRPVSREDIVSMTEKMAIVRHAVLDRTAAEAEPSPLIGLGQEVRSGPST